MCDALMEIVQEKIEERETIAKDLGISIGKNEKLQEQICKKLQKGKSVEQIADELEESVENISRMIKELK